MRVNPFTEARPYLWNGEGLGGKLTKRYLCYCLLSAYEAESIDLISYQTAKHMILSRLGHDYPTVESFLCAGHNIPLSQLTQPVVQSYRFLWLADLEKLWNQGERV